MVEQIMITFFRGIIGKVIGFFWKNRELIKKILWEVLKAIVKATRDSEEAKKEQQKQNENKGEKTTA